MNKRILSLILVLAVVLGTVCAQASPEEYQGQILPDFTVTTISGETFTLSESLKTHDLVLINFWATWCGPCQMEFPYLEEAWEQYGSRVDVIALSVEEADTHDVLTQFANDLGLRFPMGRDESNMFGTMGGSLIPTTIIVDKDRRVLTVEIGSKSSAQEFTSLFDSLLPAESQPQSGNAAERCVLHFVDTAGNPVPGVTVGFCDGEYDPVVTDAGGRVAFDGEPDKYHVHLVSVPDGYAKTWETLVISGDRFNLTVTLDHV